ncbi:ATP-binding protein [Desulfovibrio mangrovi]|uniref:sensor histidine kinase n=1 Tax=Desulfovibrio mangrovi TaxID=2976983 RepID=UPI00224658CD|nr:ATP-binding protein [Desulfovibrio mangrovi]UZP67891.1 ATP-binding protein [Desulfovibrio mangrovi]
MIPRLNIRQKIILGFLIPSICLGVLTVVSYSNLLLIEKKTYSVEFIDDMENFILEFRRQEKNFLLYGEKSSYDLAIREVDATLEMLQHLDAFSLDAHVEAMIGELRDRIEQYRARMVRMYEVASSGGKNLDTEIDKLRDIGKDLVDLAVEISKLERSNILKINKHLRSQLVFSIMGVSILFLIIFYIVSTRVLKPLKIIELTTMQIARGNFQPLEVRKANDEIRQVQEAFNRMVQELEKRQDQLVQAQKLSSIGTLSAGIAHQVNNPLNNISTSAQILRDVVKDSVDPFGMKMLGNIETETARARDIVRGLLEFARHTELSIKLVPLKGVVDKAVQLVSSQVPPGVTVTVNVPEDIRLELDPQRMGEVLLNLVLNAIQAIETLPGEISLYLGNDAPENMVTLIVEDTGKGINENDLPHIFDPFFTRKEVGKGTGLGLSVAYGIIEEFKGRIRAESQEGVGTRFMIDLPLPSASADGGEQ